ncbi:hypothetical protein Tco_1129727, partial [Tanacetum coccineum]
TSKLKEGNKKKQRRLYYATDSQKAQVKDLSAAQIINKGSDEEEIYLSTDDERTELECEVAESEKSNEKAIDEDEVHLDEELDVDNEAHDDEYVHDYVKKHDDADEEMNDEENADEVKDDQVVDDAEKVDYEKTDKEKEKPKVPPSSFSLSLSSNYGNQFLNLSSDTSLVAPLLDVHVSIIPKQTTRTPLITPLLTPPTSSEAPTITTTLPDPLPAVIQRLSEIERKFESWTKVDHSKAIEELVQANIINEVKNHLPKFLAKAISDFVNPRIESIVRDVLQKTPALLAQSSSTPGQSSSKVAECLFENEVKQILFDKMDISRSGDVNPDKVLRKRDHGNDQDPTARSDQGKKKRRKGKDSDPSKDKVQTSSSSKSKTLSKPSSTNKPVNAEEPLHEAEMDVEEPIQDDVVNAADQPQDDTNPKKVNYTWFKLPPRPETPDPKWNKDKTIDDGPE